MLRVLEEEPAVSMKFMNYLLLRNLRMEQNLIDHLFNSSEKSWRARYCCWRDPVTEANCRLFSRRSIKTRWRRWWGRRDRGLIFHEQIPQTGIHSL